jgi:hypothetical protein
VIAAFADNVGGDAEDFGFHGGIFSTHLGESSRTLGFLVCTGLARYPARYFSPSLIHTLGRAMNTL